MENAGESTTVIYRHEFTYLSNFILLTREIVDGLCLLMLNQNTTTIAKADVATAVAAECAQIGVRIVLSMTCADIGTPYVFQSY